MVLPLNAEIPSLWLAQSLWFRGVNCAERMYLISSLAFSWCEASNMLAGSQSGNWKVNGYEKWPIPGCSPPQLVIGKTR